MNVLAWVALGAISGYTAFHLGPVDPSIGVAGQALVATIGSFVTGALAGLALGVDPLGPRIDMAVGWIALVGSIVAIVLREEALQRRLAGSQRQRLNRGGGSS
jgi:uncharacterized membrane protein YeaQ/YmgE (transglycosylase-associated protein family)